MNRRYALLALPLPLLMLAACDEASEDDDGRTASGEVLEGTISDSELPLGELRSQPPLLSPSPPAGGTGGAAEGAAEADTAADLDAEQPVIESAVE